MEMNHAQSIKLKPWQEAASGSIAGIASRLVISPFDVVKVKCYFDNGITFLAHLDHFLKDC